MADSQKVPLKMARGQKIALLAIVSLGVLVIVAAIVRLVQILRYDFDGDRTWDFSNITTWTAIEVDTGLFCASAPAIRPVIRKLTPRFMSYSLDDPSNSPTYQRHESRHQRTDNIRHASQPHNPASVDAYELNSQMDLNLNRTEKKTTYKFWTHKGEADDENDCKDVTWDDSNSEDAVLGSETKRERAQEREGVIMKTVSVKVTDHRSESCEEGKREKGVERFESV